MVRTMQPSYEGIRDPRLRNLAIGMAIASFGPMYGAPAIVSLVGRGWVVGTFAVACAVIGGGIALYNALKAE